MFGNLVNPQAIALTRSSAYIAAKMVMGLAAPQAQLLMVANNYTKFIIPKLNRAATVPQILGDLDFSRFISQAKDATDSSLESKIEKGAKSIAGEFGLHDTPLGVPNWIVYLGLGGAAYYFYKKRNGGGFKIFGATPAAVKA